MLDIKEKVRLVDFCTMRTGGEARFFCVVNNLADLQEALIFSRDKGLKFFVLGGGSNVIFSDDIFDGLIIKDEIKGKEIEKKGEDSFLLKLGSGENWDESVKYSLKNGLCGLENLSNIPGTVGASAVQNIGAYGAEVKDFIEQVEVFDTKDFKIFSIPNKDCLFEYRNSFFKKRKDLIIISVTYKLSKTFTPNLKYLELKNYFFNKTVDNFSAEDIRNAVIEFRKLKLPAINELGSVGSFFKNPIILKNEYEKILEKFPTLPCFEVDKERVKIPLGFVLDKICLLKGYRIGDVGLYEKQALVVVNYGKAKTFDILKFVAEIKKIVKEKINLDIEEEAEIIF